MARTPTRQQITNRATQPRSPNRSGGTTAPRSAAKGSQWGLNRATLPHGAGHSKKPPGHRGPTGGGGGPAAPTPSSYKPTPWNSQAEQIVAGARRDYLGAQTNFDVAEREAKQDYGLDPGFNDYKANPYSRAAALEAAYQNANRGTTNSAGLQLYSGSTSNNLAGNRSTRDLNYNNLSNAYREALGEITHGRTEAAERKAEEEREAEWKRIEAAEAQEPEAESSPAGGGSGGGWKGQAPKGKGAGTIKPWNPPKKKGKK